jgi:CRISPR-associated protein Cas2
MSAASDYLVVYDLSSDKERTRVASLLEGYGFRAQWSVFECRLTKAGSQSLEQALEELGLESGTVCLYRRLKGSMRRVIGSPEQAGELPEENPSIFIV